MNRRFWSKVSLPTNRREACWEWTGARTSAGYGNFWDGSRNVLAHRFSSGVPEGRFACHECDNPGCVNPSHIYSGTPQSNMEDLAERGNRNLQTKVSDAEVREIRYGPGSTAYYAEKFGIHRAHASKIRYGVKRKGAK